MNFRVAIALAVCVSAAAAAQPLNVIEFSHPPFASVDADGKPKGAEVEFTKAILKEAGYEAVFTFVPFPRMLAALKSGEADVGPLLVRTPQRDVDMLFSASPVLSMNPVIIVKKESALKSLAKLEDLKGLNLCIGAGITPPAFFGAAAGLEVTYGDNTTSANIKKVLAGRSDGAVELNPYSALLELKGVAATDKARLVDIPGSATVFQFTVSRKAKNAEAIMAAIDKVLKAKKVSLADLLAKATK